jgi:hypothetical protein
MKLLLAALAASLTVGCAIGTRPRKFQPAAGPAGVTVTLDLREARFEGELLAIDDSALIIRRFQGSAPVAVVRFAAIRGTAFRQVGVSFAGRHAPRPDDREKLRLVSRFPQGLTPDLFRRLLAAYAQAEPVVY